MCSSWVITGTFHHPQRTAPPSLIYRPELPIRPLHPSSLAFALRAHLQNFSYFLKSSPKTILEKSFSVKLGTGPTHNRADFSL